MWHIVLLYGLLVLLILMYLAVKQVEHFQTVKEVTPSATSDQTCFQCMTYYKDALAIPNPDNMVSYIRGRNQYIQDALDSFQRFIESSVNNCSKNGSEATVTEVVTCFGNYVNEFLKKCQTSSSFMECVVARTLADTIYKKALMCGTQACSLADFKVKFAAAIKAMNDEFYACKMDFQKQDDPCVVMYKGIIESKKGKPLDSMQDSTPVTRDVLNEKLGDMVTFAMNMT